MKKLFLIPAKPGLVIKDPYTHKPLKEDGEWKPEISYWTRRVNDGSCVEGKPPKAEKQPTEKKPAKAVGKKGSDK